MRSNLINRVILCSALSISARAARADERLVTFPTPDGLALAGTLSVPPGQPPSGGWPALLLVQGSGPTDRDGNSRLLPGVKVDLLRQVAAALADDGIATLRYDKRGMNANRAQMAHGPAGMAAFFDWDRFVDDVIAGYRFLDTQAGIDPRRVGLLGHSEGGSLVLVAADRLRGDPNGPAVLVLLSTMGRREDQVLADQLTRAMARQGATTQQSEGILKAHWRIAAAVERTGRVPADVPPGLAALYPAYLGPFLKGSLSVDGAALAGAYPGPVLVVAGGRDVQVSPTLDGGALDAKLKTRHPDDHAFVNVPAASHNLKRVTGDADPAFAGPVAPEALTVIRAWCRDKLSTGGVRWKN